MSVTPSISPIQGLADYLIKSNEPLPKGRVLLHLVDGKLVAQKTNELGVWDTIKWWFGFREFRLKTIVEILTEEVKNRTACTKEDALAIDLLNKKIEKYNSAHPQRRALKKINAIFHDSFDVVIPPDQKGQFQLRPLFAPGATALEDPSPAELSFRIQRDSSHKHTPVHPPFIMNVPSSDGTTTLYTLTRVVVGQKDGKEDFYTPASDPEKGNEYPTKWNKNGTTVQWRTCKNAIQQRGVLYVYEKTQEGVRHRVPETFSPMAIRGLENPSCLCYYNASLVALFASPALRKKLLNESSPIAKKLQNVFLELSSPKTAQEPLEHAFGYRKRKKDGALQELDLALAGLNASALQKGREPVFPDITSYTEQQDAQELVLPLLEMIFKDHPLSCTLVETKERPKETSLLSKEERREALRLLPPDAPEVPLSALFIPQIDCTFKPETFPMLIPRIPSERALFDLQAFFTGYSCDENIDIDGIRGHAENSGLLTDDMLIRLSASSTKTIEVQAKHHIEGTPPDILPIYIPRFAGGREKNTTPVDAPYRLTVPVGTKGETATYVLRSVVHHAGTTINGGHYTAYIPDESTIDAPGGIPTQWVHASDSSPKVHISHDQAASELSENGVLYIYDREASE